MRVPKGRTKTRPSRIPSRVRVVHAKEEKPPKGAEPIEWFLLTNEPVESVEAACERVGWYLQRWKIERFHHVLKSGCTVEKLQERSIDRTTLLVFMYSVISIVIMNMTYVTRVNPEEPCSTFFEEAEWKLLYRAANKTGTSPAKPYGMGKAVEYLGRLGGPKRAPGDGPPGVKAVWAGLGALNALLACRDWMNDSAGQV